THGEEDNRTDREVAVAEDSEGQERLASLARRLVEDEDQEQRNSGRDDLGDGDETGDRAPLKPLGLHHPVNDHQQSDGGPGRPAGWPETPRAGWAAPGAPGWRPPAPGSRERG